MSKQGVLLVNLGSPDSPAVGDVRRYLRQFLMDGRVLDAPYPIRFCVVHFAILPSRPKQSAEAYEKVWLPEGSPLLNCTPGSPQDTASFEGHKWTQKSIHPHATNAIPWDKDKHGFHTYYGEMLHWLNQ